MVNTQKTAKLINNFQEQKEDLELTNSNINNNNNSQHHHNNSINDKSPVSSLTSSSSPSLLSSLSSSSSPLNLPGQLLLTSKEKNWHIEKLSHSHSQNSDHNNHISPVHYVVQEIPQEDEERLEKLFNQLDRDNNGKIDIHDLSAALKEFGLSSVYAETFLKQSDQTQSGDVGLAEFIQYVREHEKNLRLQFSHLDKNKDGKVDLEELISAFKDLGIDMDPSEAANLLQRMDQDGSLNISFDEWRDFLLLAPSTDIHGLIKFWRHSTPPFAFMKF